MISMDASEMARRRWENVSPQERSRLARSAALVRWANATKHDLAMARARAAKAREARTRATAARLLGVDVSDLAGVNVKVVSRSWLRSQKSREQAMYWRQLREGPRPRPVCVDPKRARRATIVHPPSFRMFTGSANGSRS